MAESPKVTLVSETMRHIGDGEWSEATDIWRHEGLKRGVEQLLYVAGRTDSGRGLLSHMAGEVIDDPRLHTELAGLRLAGPVGIGAGWDKSGRTVLGWQAAGARHITPGGIPRYPQAGLPMPRLFTMDAQIGDHGKRVSRNAFGFYSPGADKVVYNLAKQRESGALNIPIIAQVTVNKEFYLKGNRHLIPGMLAETIRKVLPVADGISLGLSSPNTLGMRAMQDQYDYLYTAVSAARQAASSSDRHIPLFYKGDGDGGEARLESLCRIVDATDTDGLELINTTGLARIRSKYGITEGMPGGLAGMDEDYQRLAVESIQYVYEAIGDHKAIHGMGGVTGADNGEQAVRLLRAGASALSINTGVRAGGIGVIRAVERGIIAELDRQPNITSLAQIIGADTVRGAKAAA